MRLDLNQHRKTDKTNHGQGQRALIESLQRELVEKRDAASSLSNCRSHKTGVLRALRLQFTEVDSAGGQSAALRARLEPLGMRRELLQYRLDELQHQMADLLLRAHRV